MSEVTLHAQGGVTGTGGIQPNVQAVTAPEDISFAQEHGLTDPNNRRDQPIKLQDGLTVFISNNQLQTIKEGLKRNPGAYPELDEGIRRALSGGAVLPSTQPAAPAGPRVMSHEQIQSSFVDGLERYQREHGGGSLSNSSSQYDTKRLAKHLFSHGNDVSDKTIISDHVTGKEFALKQAIQEEVKKTGHKLNPGDVLRLALELNGGDTFKATLCAQNTLRALARGREEDGYASQDSNPSSTFGYVQDRDFFRNNLETVREPITGAIPDQTCDDVFARESGAWYHMFCTATIDQKVGGTATTAAVIGEEAFVLITEGHRRDSQEHNYDATGAGLGEFLTRQSDPSTMHGVADNAPEISLAPRAEGTSLTSNPLNAARYAFTGDDSSIKSIPVKYNGTTSYISANQWNELHDFLQKYPGDPTEVYPGLDPRIAAEIKANRR